MDTSEETVSLLLGCTSLQCCEAVASDLAQHSTCIALCCLRMWVVQVRNPRAQP